MTKDVIPLHVGIILDGNRRWAKEKGLPQGAGHRQAVKRLESLIKYAQAKGVKYLTLYTFSTENWQRSPAEVELLMQLFREFFSGSLIQQLKQQNVRICVLGEIERFPQDIVDSLRKTISETEKNTGITVNFALSYGGRAEIVRCINRLLALGKTSISEGELSEYLYTAGQPDPDLIIRPGGEMRLSGFLLWQAAYAELYFTKSYMPDFTEKEFDLALAAYAFRQRRFGK